MHLEDFYYEATRFNTNVEKGVKSSDRIKGSFVRLIDGCCSKVKVRLGQGPYSQHFFFFVTDKLDK